MYFVHLQEAASAFRNFTIKYRNITDITKRDLSLGWQLPSRNLLLAMASTILVERGVQ